jgi:hypothetical protein
MAWNSMLKGLMGGASVALAALLIFAAQASLSLYQ